MPLDPAPPTLRVLDPLERISEFLFGLVMVLTTTATLGVVTGDDGRIKTLLVGALGCNLAWGIIDAGMYLMARLSERGRAIAAVRAARAASDAVAAQGII